MPNYNTIHTADQIVPATAQEHLDAQGLLAGEDPDQPSGFSLDYEAEATLPETSLGPATGSGIYLYAEEAGVIGSLPPEFLRYIGILLLKAGMPYLQIGYANTCSRLVPGSHGGGAWRIYPTGAVVEAAVVWGDEHAPLPGFDIWDSHPDHPRAYWQCEVTCGDTTRSYWSWVRDQIEMAGKTEGK